jgi:hypothetical protein
MPAKLASLDPHGPACLVNLHEALGPPDSPLLYACHVKPELLFLPYTSQATEQQDPPSPNKLYTNAFQQNTDTQNYHLTDKGPQNLEEQKPQSTASFVNPTLTEKTREPYL